MLPLRLSLKQIGPYRDEEVDFERVSGDVVAIVGPNGAGKTMLVDSIFASLYRYFPYRDSIYSYCQGKDARIRFAFSIRAVEYEAVLNINALKREMEPWLYRGGVAITDGKNTTFDREVRALVGSDKLALVSVYGAQDKKGSFVSLPKADRKALFIDLLGLNRLQAISEAAAAKEAEASTAARSITDKIETLKPIASGIVDTDATKRRIEDASAEILVADARVAANRKQVEKLSVAASRQGDEDKLRLASRRVERVNKDIADTAVAIARCKAAQVDAARYQVEVSQIADLEKRLEVLRTDLMCASSSQNDHLSAVANHAKEKGDLEVRLGEARRVLRSTELNLQRAQTDASLIESVPCRAEGECAECQFLTNAITAKGSIDSLIADIDNSRAAFLAIDSQVRYLVAPDPVFGEALKVRIRGLSTEINAIAPSVRNAESARRNLSAAESAAAPLASLQERMPGLQAEITQAAKELDALRESVKETIAAKEALVKAEARLDVDLEVLSGARAHHAALLTDLARLEERILASKKAQESIDELTKQALVVDRDRRSLNLLARAFSKTGIQSLEIDAVGPCVSDLANNLLLACFGPRFSVRFVTQTIKADKSGYRDDFDVVVCDNQAGREGSIDDLSGGEKVIVSEAIQLALSLFNRSRYGISWESIWRDEASSAVDDEKAPLYIQMLRRARELGSFRRLFFIAHQSRTLECADSMMRVHAGKVTLA